MADLIGQKLGQYEITAKLGSGGMANVYRARQESMGREVAIKIIESKLAENPEFVKRFGREARTIAALNHPHILKVFDFGQQDDLLYLVMELQPGGSLADLILKGPMLLEDAGHLLEQIASALDYAHEQGIVHRDLKPQNVLLDTKGNAILTDFGIAKVLNESTALTVSGTAMGTPSYMSPEQWQALPLDNRTDVYALGIMLFEMLSGKLPFSADTPFGMMHQHINQPPPLIRAYRPELPPAVEAVINKALAKNREQRFQSAGEMVRAFKNALTRKADEPLAETPTLVSAAETPRGRRSRLPIIGAAVVVVLALIGVLAIVLSSGRQAAPLTPTGTTGAGIAAAPTTLTAPPSEIPETQPPTRTPRPSASPTLTPVPPTFTRTATATPTITPNLATRAAATIALRETTTANAIASYTRTPTPNEEQTLAAIVGATETARVVASYTRTPTSTPIPPTSVPQKPRLVGLVVPAPGSDYYAMLTDGAAKAAEALGWNLEVQVPTSYNDMTALADAVSVLLGKGAEALAIDPIAFEGVSDAARLSLIKLANDKKVPLLVYNFTTSLGGTVATYLGYDQWAGAQRLAETTCDLIARKYKTTADKTQGKVFILLGVESTHVHRRTDGFKAGLAGKCPNVQVVGEETADWGRDRAFEVTTAALQKIPDIDAFFGNNDEMAIGAGQAAKNLGRKLNVDIFTVGIDGTSPAFNMLSTGGALSATLATFPDKMGELVIKEMAKILNGEKIPQALLMPSVVVTQDNLAAYLQDKLWTEPVEGQSESVSVQPPPTFAPRGGALTIWVSSGHATRVQAAVNAFATRYGVTMNVQVMDWSVLQDKFIADAPAGKGPDIVVTTSDWLVQIYTKDMLAEINLGNKVSDFDPVALQAYMHDGKLYGLPYTVNAVALYYNKDLIPNPPKTWDELKSIAQKLQDEKKVEQGFAFMSVGDAYAAYPVLSGFGGYVFGRDQNGDYDPNQVGIDSPGAIRGAIELDSMIKAGLLRNGIDYAAAWDMFAKGKLAMWLNGPWEISNFRASGIHYGVAPIPSMGKTSRPFVSADGFIVSKFSENAQLAQQFLVEFMATPEAMKTLYETQFMVPAYLPTRREITDPEQEIFAASAASGELIPVIPAMAVYWERVGYAISVIYRQEDTPENAMRSAANAARAQIAKLGK